jgi:S-adenosylmethionine-diacylgycerolhomoserine-N-methlytransferase
MTGNQLAEILQKLRKLLTPTGRIAIVDFDCTRAAWFARWMGVNHVRMDGSLATLLQKFSHVERHEQHSGLWLWRWMIWIGR